MNLNTFGLFGLLLATPLWTQAQEVCERFFLKDDRQKYAQEILIEPVTPTTVQLFRKIHLVVSEYPGDYVEVNGRQVVLTVPEARWDEIFKAPFETVVGELSPVTLNEWVSYTDQSKDLLDSKPAVPAFDHQIFKTFKNEWVPTQRAYRLALDRRIYDLIVAYPERAHFAYIIEVGVLRQEKARQDSEFRF